MMYGNYWGSWGKGFITNPNVFWNGFGIFFIPLLIWCFFWKGWALWRAAKNDSKGWFIALLVINTMGILEILYLFVFGKDKVKPYSKK